ncbi:MAG: hypothetical protein C0518_03860 [Opitutus sp.]|nr:hypothetical protein [Opitutus sp.]
MKILRAVTGLLSALALVGGLGAQTFNVGSSLWGSGGSFAGTASAGSLLASGSPNGIYYGTAQPDSNTFVFGLVNTSTPTGATSQYNLSSAMAAGTSITLAFTGLTARPDYIAYTGGPLTAYAYNSSTGTLSLTTNLVNPGASASDPTSSTLLSSFGLMIVTGSSHNFQGTVFQTGMFWDDVSPLANYSGTNFFAGVNADGINGQTASFYAYLPMAFLQANGVTEPDDAQAIVQKSAGSGAVLSNLTVDIYSPANPGFTGQSTTWSYIGPSGFNFDGAAGNDDFVLATYTNSSWSDANLGLVAVPEPATVALTFGSLALLTALWRRRALNNATMR